jgi:hypothetical protein
VGEQRSCPPTTYFYLVQERCTLSMWLTLYFIWSPSNHWWKEIMVQTDSISHCSQSTHFLPWSFLK